MKKFSHLTFVAMFMLVACQTDATREVGNFSAERTLTISLQTTRTVLGEKGESGQYPLYWSEGDCIVANGVESSPAKIDETNAAVASFTFDEALTYPCRITYPYCSATTSSGAVVNFPAEQSYVEGSFAAESAPMCAYVANQGNAVELKHLAGVLRLPILASEEGTQLEKVVITSTNDAKLSGNFDVDCEQAMLTAQSEAQSSVTYTLPSSFSLSTTAEQVLYIALPAVDVGSCTIEMVDAEGDKMTLRWSGGVVKAGVVREFKAITYASGVAMSLDPFEVVEDTLISHLVRGYVTDAAGRPISGVAVSDGFTIVTTDEQGYYEIDASRDCWYIYITVPAEYEIPVKNGQPAFYIKYNPSTSRYNFTLKALEGGKEEKVALFIIGDPQVANSSGLNRLNNEVVPAIKEHAATWQAQGVPCYGVTLGDLISNNNSSDRSEWRDDVFASFATSKSGMPIFHVMGNHDNTFFNAAKPIYADERSSTFELKAQRDHEDICGPVNFSFDRGDMHIVSMRNIMYNVNTNSESSIRRAFLEEQYEWLLQDLALVPKDKMVVLCVHIPMENGGGNRVDDIRNLINDYKEAHIMSGHSHLIQAIEAAKQPNIYEHNMGAVCGAWWTSYMCGDGSPCGYGVFVAEGATFTDWYHIGYDDTSKNRSHQMRLYRGNAVTGAALSGSNTNNTKGYYAFNFDEDVLLANVYMADSKWQIKVYEDGVYSGDMERVSGANLLPSDAKSNYARPKIYRNETSTPSSDGAGYGYMVGDGTLANPYRSTVPTAGDIYFSGYTNGVRGYGDHAVGTNSQCYHMYMYRLKNKNAEVKVEATDRFGNIYTETKITEGTDYSSVAY